ncbi:MAG TPA: hypothetical protein VII52_03005 [Gemmatimonadaceae bacterium]
MIRRRDVGLLLLLILSLVCVLVPAHVVYGQALPEPHVRPAAMAPVVITREVTFGTSRATESAADMRAAAVQRAVSTARMQTSERQHLWPWFALGGAVLGGAGVVILGVTQCGAGCQDDGALSRLPAYAAVGALAGGVVGAIIGLLVDTSISGSHSQPNKVPNDSVRHESSVVEQLTHHDLSNRESVDECPMP